MGNCMNCFGSGNDASDGSEPLLIKGSKNNKTLENSRSSTDEESTLYSKSINLDDFDIEKVIGRGSFGKVYLVKKKNNGKFYAMKVLKKESIQKQKQKIHTRAEREILERINNPFVVKLHYAFQTPDKLYFIVDFLNGGELFHHLKKETRFTESRAKFYAAEIVLALECLHAQNIIYRDLKPENVLLDSEGHIKITDFGLSKMNTGTKKTYTFCGTPEYLAPEVIQGSGHDKAVDWWSLGALLYEMLSGRPPFYSKNRSQMLRSIVEKKAEMKPYFSDEARSLLEMLLEPKPNKRLGAGPTGSEDIKNHEFFQGLDWDMVFKREMEPPYVPSIKAENDLSNIDKMFTSEKAKETPTESKLNLQQKFNNKFDAFTYKKEELLSTQIPSHISQAPHTEEHKI